MLRIRAADRWLIEVGKAGGIEPHRRRSQPRLPVSHRAFAALQERSEVVALVGAHDEAAGVHARIVRRHCQRHAFQLRRTQQTEHQIVGQVWRVARHDHQPVCRNRLQRRQHARQRPGKSGRVSGSTRWPYAA